MWYSAGSPFGSSTTRWRMMAFSSSSGAPPTTWICQGCRLPPDGARAALSTISRISCGGTGLSRKPRIERRVAMASLTFMVSSRTWSGAECAFAAPGVAW